MTEIERSLNAIIDVFRHYSVRIGSKQSLTKSRMKTLMEEQLPGFLQSARDKDTVGKLLKDLDTHGNDEVDFNQFMVYIAALTTASHSYLARGGLV